MEGENAKTTGPQMAELKTQRFRPWLNAQRFSVSDL